MRRLNVGLRCLAPDAPARQVSLRPSTFDITICTSRHWSSFLTQKSDVWSRWIFQTFTRKFLYALQIRVKFHRYILLVCCIVSTRNCSSIENKRKNKFNPCLRLFHASLTKRKGWRARIVDKHASCARSAIKLEDGQERKRERRGSWCIEGASAVRICWFTDRARVYIIILDAGYTYLYKEGPYTPRRYPPRYLYGLLQRFRQLRDQREEQEGERNRRERGGEVHDRSKRLAVLSDFVRGT